MREDIRQIKASQKRMESWQEVADLTIKDHSKTLNDHETRLVKP